MLCLHLYPSLMNIKESVFTCARKPAKHCWHGCLETLKTTHINRDCHASLAPCLSSLRMLVSVTLSPSSSPFFHQKQGWGRAKAVPKSSRAPHSDLSSSWTQQNLWGVRSPLPRQGYPENIPPISAACSTGSKDHREERGKGGERKKISLNWLPSSWQKGMVFLTLVKPDYFKRMRRGGGMM